MFIQWYPGHMTKAIRMMKEETSIVDSVVYVLDARAVASSINSNFEQIIANKTVLYVINKADLTPRSEVEKWKALFESEGKKCLLTDSLQKGGSQVIISGLLAINRPVIERYAAKGVKKSVRAMVIGIPNCGKSTLINSLLPKKKVATGNKPGVTKGKQWVSIDKNIDLLDTPGTLYPDFSDQRKAVNLAIIGSVREEIFDIQELSYEIISFLKKNNSAELAARYGLENIELPSDKLLYEIAKAKKMVLKAGEFDIARAAKTVITDFRKLAFGKIILEKANS